MSAKPESCLLTVYVSVMYDIYSCRQGTYACQFSVPADKRSYCTLGPVSA